MLTALLLAGTAAAQPGQLHPIVTGEDLVAWRNMPAEPAPELMMDFIETWPDSVLTELAWRALLEVEIDLPDNPPYSKIALSVQQHQEALDRVRHHQVVATLTP